MLNLFYLGTLEECHQEFEKISQMEEESENKKCSQNSSIHLNDKSKNAAINSEVFAERIEQLEHALIEKEIRIKNLEKKLQEQEEMNFALKNTFSKKHSLVLF